jgi:hypothetical protein
MPLRQHLISCTLHIDNLVAAFKAKPGRTQSAAQLCLKYRECAAGVGIEQLSYD